MSRPASPRRPRPPLPLVFVEPIRCPQCSSTDLQSYGTTRHADGARNRYTQCRRCRTKFLVIIDDDS